jgi:hypothetical protein
LLGERRAGRNVLPHREQLDGITPRSVTLKLSHVDGEEHESERGNSD